MALHQNITLRLPRELLKRIKRLAADQDTSVSALMAEALTRLADASRRYKRRDADLWPRCDRRDPSAWAAALTGRVKNSMNGDPPREFVDANVLVYAFDKSSGVKHEIAQQLLKRLWDSGGGCLSVQILQEFFVTVTRKVAQPLPVDEAADRIREFATWQVFTPTPNDVLAAVELHKHARLNFWDAMVVEAAAELGCEILWTEELNEGQLLRAVRVRNPFSVRQG